MLKTKSEGFTKVLDDLVTLNYVDGINYGHILLLSKIDALSGNGKYQHCMASNAGLAAMLCTSKRNVKKYLQKLKELNIITTTEKRAGLTTMERQIIINYDIVNDLINANLNLRPSKIDGEQSFPTSNVDGEQSFPTSDTSGTKRSKIGNKKVIDGEQKGQRWGTNVPPNKIIIDNNIYNNINNTEKPVADADLVQKEKLINQILSLYQTSDKSKINKPKEYFTYTRLVLLKQESLQKVIDILAKYQPQDEDIAKLKKTVNKLTYYMTQKMSKNYCDIFETIIKDNNLVYDTRRWTNDDYKTFYDVISTDYSWELSEIQDVIYATEEETQIDTSTIKSLDKIYTPFNA